MTRVMTGASVSLDGYIAGPNETGFDRLFAMGPHEIQVGILKRLRGAPIARHTDEHAMVYSDAPPYEILQSASLAFSEVQRMKRFARFYDLVVNHGRFPSTTKLLLGASPFTSFLAFSDWLYGETGARHGIALPRLAELIGTYLIDVVGVAHDVAHGAIVSDLGKEKLPTALVKGIPRRQQRHLQA